MAAWRDMMPNECQGCAAYSACHGGCRAVQELRPDHRDPLRRSALTSFSSHVGKRTLPAEGRPVLQGTVRPEPFGYVILGQGQLLPVRAEAGPLLAACDGTSTFSTLTERFSQPGLELLGDLWEVGLLQIT